MRVGLEHIDSEIASAIEKHLCGYSTYFQKAEIRWNEKDLPLATKYLGIAVKATSNRWPTEDERIAHIVYRKRQSSYMRRLLITLFAPLLGGAAVYGLFNAMDILVVPEIAGVATFVIELVIGIV